MIYQFLMNLQQYYWELKQNIDLIVNLNHISRVLETLKGYQKHHWQSGFQVARFLSFYNYVSSLIYVLFSIFYSLYSFLYILFSTIIQILPHFLVQFPHTYLQFHIYFPVFSFRRIVEPTILHQYNPKDVLMQSLHH